MQQALPYRMWLSTPLRVVDSHSTISQNADDSSKSKSTDRSLKDRVSENAVILIGKRGCCMCHAMKRLLLMLGVNPAVYEVDEEEEEAVINEVLGGNCEGTKGAKSQFPSMFIGGKLFGGLDRLMAAHISGELIPMLKQAGALWL